MLEASDAGRAVLEAIRELNGDVTVEDRGAYLRVGVPGRCLLTREVVEAKLGRPFRLPLDLEALMPAFQGLIRIGEDRVEWSAPA